MTEALLRFHWNNIKTMLNGNIAELIDNNYFDKAKEIIDSVMYIEYALAECDYKINNKKGE